MAGDEAEKTEPATPKRREDARRRGEVAQSRELPTVIILATALLAGGSFLGVGLARALAAQAVSAWGGASGTPASVSDYHAVLLLHMGTAGLALLPLLLLLAAAAALTQLVQTGPLFSPEALAFKPERLDPFKGLKRLLSPEKAVELAKAAVKVSVVGGLAWRMVGGDVADVLALFGVGIDETLVVGAGLARRVAIAALSALLALALFDVGWQRYRWEKRLRMSRAEVRDELKQREGSPQVRSRFRARQLEVTRQRMIAGVSDADVVITNPTQFAVALRYDSAAMGAPRLVAKGRGHVAQRIRQAAQEAGVPLVENPPLARALHRSVEIGREIPEKLFQAVAEVLAAVYRLRPRRAGAWGAAS